MTRASESVLRGNGHGSEPLARIYLSSTFEDLESHREAVCATLRQMGHVVASMEDYTAAGERPLDKCIEDVAASDAYVGIFAWRHGFRPPGHTESITRLELQEAEARGKPCFIFLLADDAPWSPKSMDDDRGPILGLRSHLKERYLVQFFSTADGLARNVATSIANHYASQHSEHGSAASPEELGYFRDQMSRCASGFRFQYLFYLATSVLVAAFGGAAFAFAQLQEGEQLVWRAGGLLFESVTIVPATAMLSTRRKKSLIEGYVAELSKERPATVAVLAVRRFLQREQAQAGMV